ncbi:hypothetical protein EON63_05455 [archaeon]|nr:MAG: hypothetical protein EON63_05455 [archaeon]
MEVEYESLPGWKEDISKCRRYSDLPLNCRRYIERVEQLMGMKVRFIGVGADRGDIIDRGDL